MKYLKTHEGYKEEIKRLNGEIMKITTSIIKDIKEILIKFGEIKFYYEKDFPEDNDVFSVFEGNNFVISERIWVEDDEDPYEDDKFAILESIQLNNDEIMCVANWKYRKGVYLKYQDPNVLIYILDAIKTLTPELMEERKVRREAHKFNF